MSLQGIETAFIARVGTEPEVKTSQAGKPWAALNVCVGDRDDDQQWVRVVVFGGKATSLSLAKGDRVYVEGPETRKLDRQGRHTTQWPEGRGVEVRARW